MRCMKHIFIGLLFIILVMGYHLTVHAYDQQELLVTVHLTTYFNETNQISNDITGNYYGDHLSFDGDVETDSGYDFAFWVVNGAVHDDFGFDYVFTLTENMNLTAIFKPVGLCAVAFMDSNLQLLDVQYVESGSDVHPDITTYPTKPGYTLSNDKWDTTLMNITKDQVIKLIYVKETVDTYLLTVNHGTLIGGASHAVIPYNGMVTIEANALEAEQYFQYWVIDNRIVSQQLTYSFTIMADTTITAIYGDSAVNDTPNVSLSASLNLMEDRNTFLGQFYLPNGYTLIEFGMITSNEIGMIDLGSSPIKRTQGMVYVPSTHEWMMSFSIDSSVSSRAYLICKDSSNQLRTYYNEFLDLSAASIDIGTDYVTTPASSLVSSGWTISGVDTASDGRYQLNTSGEYIETPQFSATSGPLTYTFNAWATGSIATDTFKIEAFDVFHNLVDTSGNITVSSAGILSSVSSYKDVIQVFSNSDSNITSIRLTFNKELTGTNLRVSSIYITSSGTSKEIQSLSVTIPINRYSIDDSIDLTDSSLYIYYFDGTYSMNILTTSMISQFDTSTSGTFNMTITYQNFTQMVEYTVLKIDPVYTVPLLEDTEYTSGLVLGDIVLPIGFTWNEPNTDLEVGTYTFLATYTPTNLGVYNIIEDISITFHVVEVTTPVMIYEIYGGGGNINATYLNDYVVLYNSTNSPIDLAGYSLQYASNLGTTYNVMVLTDDIQAKGYYLIQLYSGGSIGSTLPTVVKDTFTTNLNQTLGKLALVSSTNMIASPNDEEVVDFVGYGNVDECEGASTLTLSAILSAKRNSLIDTDNNQVDFTVDTPDLTYLTANRTLESIEVNNLNSTYVLDEPLDLTNATIHLNYSDETSDNIPLLLSMITDFDSSLLGTYQMTISYNGILTLFTYNIVDESSLDNVAVYSIDLGATGGDSGEATLIKVRDIEILIDSGSGDSNSETELLSFLNSKVTDGQLDYVIATHPDSDHIGGMNGVFEAFHVLNVIQYSTSSSSSTATRISYENTVTLEDSHVDYIQNLVTSGNPTLELTEGVTLHFYNTSYLTSTNTNASSIVFVLEAFSTRVLFNGDAESPQEAVYAPLVGDVSVMKMGHHGSANGTSTILLNSVKPEVAFVNDGNYLGNEYSHPTYLALSHLYTYSNNLPVYSVTGGNGSTSDRMLQRNGDLTLTISSLSYTFSSQYYGINPIDISATSYWHNSTNTYSSLGYYYASATGILSATSLKSALHNIIDDHISYSYDYAKTGLALADIDPNNSNNVLLMYTGRSQAASTFGGAVDEWNREHTWANSHGIDDQLPAYSDLFNLRATDTSVNSMRGDMDFGLVAHTTANLVNDTYGVGSTYCYRDTNYFEPRDEVKGDIARILFYMSVRYEGDSGEPDLELVNGMTSTTSNNIGDLATLIIWFYADPVTSLETNRNNVVYGIQNNRNPFIDRPEFAMIIFG